MPLLFGFGITVNTIFSLFPSTSIPEIFNFWDKSQHTISFTVLAFTGCIAYPKNLKRVAIGLTIYGAIIEIMQSTLTATRFGDIFDWIADGTGVVIGVAIYALLNNINQKRDTDI